MRLPFVLEGIQTIPSVTYWDLAVAAVDAGRRTMRLRDRTDLSASTGVRTAFGARTRWTSLAYRRDPDGRAAVCRRYPTAPPPWARSSSRLALGLRGRVPFGHAGTIVRGSVSLHRTFTRTPERSRAAMARPLLGFLISGARRRSQHPPRAARSTRDIVSRPGAPAARPRRLRPRGASQ